MRGAQAHDALRVALEAGVCVGVEFMQDAQQSLFDEPLRLFVGTPDAALLFEEEDATAAFVRIATQGAFCALDAKHVLQKVYAADSSVPAAFDAATLSRARFFDIGLAAYLLNSSGGPYEYASLCDTYLGGALPEAKDAFEAAAAHVLAAARLSEALRCALEADGSLACYEAIDAPLVATLATMERVGAKIDVETLAAIGARTTEELEGLRRDIHGLVGEEFNVDSPKQARPYSL